MHLQGGGREVDVNMRKKDFKEIEMKVEVEGE